MSQREKILVQYALLLGAYGEDSPQVHAFEKTEGNSPDLWAAFVEILEAYRLNKDK